jgi:hypothetical protein
MKKSLFPPALGTGNKVYTHASISFLAQCEIDKLDAPKQRAFHKIHQEYVQKFKTAELAALAAHNKLHTVDEVTLDTESEKQLIVEVQLYTEQACKAYHLLHLLKLYDKISNNAFDITEHHERVIENFSQSIKSTLQEDETLKLESEMSKYVFQFIWEFLELVEKIQNMILPEGKLVYPVFISQVMLALIERLNLNLQDSQQLPLSPEATPNQLLQSTLAFNRNWDTLTHITSMRKHCDDELMQLRIKAQNIPQENKSDLKTKSKNPKNASGSLGEDKEPLVKPKKEEGCVVS